ncbi:uncharacterized protein LOC121380386 [Gigantopelta aegis]|uniref:uncharacterized protein LOC121380386 n=1 Tax=Gigantopelta aegis TaxID=1735272 RepID=UPI001B88B62C|nr:uncharacterized protein LOC121380386 [Gigantopelta aegis]
MAGETSVVNPTPGPTSGIGLNITECNKVFLPEFVAILSNNSFGQAVLDHLGIHQSHTTPAPEDDPQLIYNDCQADFLPDFVAILSNSTMGQAVLENLQQQGLVTFRLSRA